MLVLSLGSDAISPHIGFRCQVPLPWFHCLEFRCLGSVALGPLPWFRCLDAKSLKTKHVEHRGLTSFIGSICPMVPVAERNGSDANR
jgi:hypothetical protein